MFLASNHNKPDAVSAVKGGRGEEGGSDLLFAFCRGVTHLHTRKSASVLYLSEILYVCEQSSLIILFETSTNIECGQYYGDVIKVVSVV